MGFKQGCNVARNQRRARPPRGKGTLRAVERPNENALRVVEYRPVHCAGEMVFLKLPRTARIDHMSFAPELLRVICMGQREAIGCSKVKRFLHR